LVGELRAHLAGRLPDYMVPAAFVVLEQLPLAANGKIDQRRLPVPEYTRESADAPFVAPRTAAEARLAQIWQEVLRIAQIGVHDNFFALGGDSMLSIQIVARAKEVGLQLTPKQIFQHQTVAALAQLAQGAGVAAEQGIVSGPIPLTPGQHIYFSVPQENHHYSNIAILLEIDQPPVLPLLRQAVAHLAAHHDGLRARFTQTGAGWQAHILPPEEQAIPVVAVDLAGLPAEEQRAAIEAAVAEFQRSLHLTRGPVGRVAHFDLGPGRPGRLLLLFHHLLLDTISLTPLQQDLMTAYQQLAQGQPVKLPPKTTSVRYWAERLVRYAQSEQARAEAAYWLAQPWERIAPLPADFPESRGLNIQGSLQSVTASLSAAETRVLTEHLHEAHGAQMLDAILVALGQAFAPWLEADTLLVEVLVHGRHTLFDDVDLSRTLNWTGNFVPIFVDTGAADTAAALERVVAYRSGLPPESCSFGAIKTLSQDPAIRARAQSLPRADVMLNYHGVLSQQGDDEAGAPFRKAAESVSACIDPRNVRPEAFWCQGGIIGGCLSIDFMYSTNMYRRGSVEPVAERFRAALQRLALSCQGYATKESYV
jgi:non-ribosomal peptide synthase protein (TIGR01720 family)